MSCSPHKQLWRRVNRGISPSGVTLTELLVALSVVAVLIGLLLPAVQRVRLAAGRTTCANNLRQLGIAVQNYESALGTIPKSFCGGGIATRECFSAQSRLLPYLEQAPLAAAIDPSDPSLDFNGRPPFANATNGPFLRQKVAVFLCPADALAREGAVSYRQSAGWNVIAGGNDPLPNRLAGFRDGLSQTAIFSERSVSGGPPTDPRNPLIISFAGPEDLAGPACVQAQQPPATGVAGDPYAGATWLRGADRHTQYIHFFPPNSRLRDCEVDGWVSMALMTARSQHVSGVNVLFADGHLAFTADGIDLKVWRAWGTPNGGETVH